MEVDPLSLGPCHVDLASHGSGPNARGTTVGEPRRAKTYTMRRLHSAN
jgi:hypothetical protein